MYLTWGARHCCLIGGHAFRRADLGDVFREAHDPAFEPTRSYRCIGRALLIGRNVDRPLSVGEELSPQDGSGDEDGGANFHGQTRKNDTQASLARPSR